MWSIIRLREPQPQRNAQVGTAVRSLSCATDGSMVVAANNSGTCYVWRLQRGSSGSTTHFEPFHKLAAHNAYILKCLISPDGRCVRLGLGLP